MSREKEIVLEVLQKIEQNMELFYQQKNMEALGEFQQVLVLMMNMVDAVFAYRDTHEGFELDEEKIKAALTEAMSALENNDYVLLADVIQYDFVEYMQELTEIME